MFTRNCIGLDIGSSSIKIVQLTGRGHRRKLQNFGVQPLPSQSIVDGAVLNHGGIVDALRTLVERIGLRGKDVAIAVSGNGVIVKRISMPQMEEAAFQEQMQWEIQQNIPFAIDEVSVDYEVIDVDEVSGQMEVMLVAAKKDVIEQYLALVRDAGLNPVIVDTAAFSVQNAIEVAAGLPTGESCAVINVGASSSTIAIVKNKVPVFNRNVGSGGNTFTEAIQQKMGVSQEGAEAYKLGSSSGADVVPEEVEKVMAEVAEKMASEFQRSIDFFVKDSLEDSLQRIYLTGGTALVTSLEKAVAKQSGIPVEVFNPFSPVSIDERRFDVNYIAANAPVAAVAMGLALRKPGDAA